MAINLQKTFSALNEKLAVLFDESGVRRSFTVPYIDGQDMHEHVSAVGQAAQDAGGLMNNLVTTAHHSGGKGWGTGDGQTVGHPGDALRNTIIPKEDEKAKAVISAAQKHLSGIASLIGEDDPAVKTSQGQLDLVKKTDGAGMNLLDFGVMMIQIMHGPNQAIARAHQGTKPGGHSPKASIPHDPQAEQPQGGEAGPEGAAPAEGAQPEGAPAEAPAPAAAAPVAAAAPATPQAQG